MLRKLYKLSLLLVPLILLMSPQTKAQDRVPLTSLSVQSASTCNTANSFILLALQPSQGGATFTVKSNASANTISFFGSGDGQTSAADWVPINVTPSNTTTAVTTTTAVGPAVFTMNTVGYTHICIQITTLVGGTVTVGITAGTGSARSGGGGGGTPALSSLTSAVGSNTLTNGNNPQTWQCAQTTAPQSCITFNESAASTGGTVTNLVPNQSVLNLATATGSTAAALTVSGNNNTATNQPLISMTETVNNASLAETPYVFRTIETSQSAGGNVFEVLGGASGNTPMFTLGASNGGSIVSFVNAWEQVFAAGSLNFKTPNGTAWVPTNVGSIAVNDGTGSGVNFGSKINFQTAACETNFAPTTLSTVAVTTTTGLSCLPANSIIDGVVGRVTTAITGGCTGWEFGDGTTAARFTANNTTLTLGATAVPFSGSAWTTGIASATTGMSQTAASAITITCAGAAATAGAIRVIVYYHTLVNPTS